jgi:hypothetical protein
VVKIGHSVWVREVQGSRLTALLFSLLIDYTFTKSVIMRICYLGVKRLRCYLSWITQFYAFCDKSLCDDVSSEEIDGFLRHLMKSREDWQVSRGEGRLRALWR